MGPLTIILATALGLATLACAVIYGRNWPITDEVPVFSASRFTRGNHLWPTQVAVFPDRVVRHTPRLLGYLDETTRIDQVASVIVSGSMIFGDVIIETTGGSQPIRCHGHFRGDAEKIRRQITEAQEAQSKPAVGSNPGSSTGPS